MSRIKRYLDEVSHLEDRISDALILSFLFLQTGLTCYSSGALTLPEGNFDMFVFGALTCFASVHLPRGINARGGSSE